MKFDKFMEHCFKILALVTVLVVAVGSVVSCARPLRACAVEITAEEQAGINDFLDVYAENLSGIDFELNSDSDGNRNVRLQILGRQQLAYNELFQIYDNLDFSVAPSTVSVSGSGASGLYRSALDNNIHGVTVRNPLPVGTYTGTVTATFATSDEFSYTVTFIPDSNSYLEISGVNNTYIPGMPVKPRGYYYKGRVLCSGNSYFSAIDAYSSTLYGSHVFGAYLTQDGNIPTVSRNYAFNSSYNFPSEKHIGALGQNVTLPSEDVPTSTPWEYYNEYILPDLQEDFPGYDDFFVFPDGYYPDVEPTEPNYQTTNNVYIIPIIIGDPLPVDITDDLGNILDVLDILADLLPDGGLQIQIDGITLTFPRDGDSVVIDGTKYPLPLPDFQIDGHTINLPDNVHFDFDGIPFTINSDGTITINGDTYNLPIGTPTQLTTEYDNYVYEYEIPTIEKINIVDAELSVPDLTDYVDGISFMSGAMSDFIDGIGLMPFIIACLSLGAITYVIWKIGG